MTLLTLGQVHTLQTNVIYALPSKRCLGFTDNSSLEVSFESEFVPLTVTTNNFTVSAKFIRCVVGTALVIFKEVSLVNSLSLSGEAAGDDLPTATRIITDAEALAGGEYDIISAEAGATILVHSFALYARFISPSPGVTNVYIQAKSDGAPLLLGTLTITNTVAGNRRQWTVNPDRGAQDTTDFKGRAIVATLAAPLNAPFVTESGTHIVVTYTKVLV